MLELVQSEDEASLRSALQSSTPDQQSLDQLLSAAVETQNLTIMCLLLRAGAKLTDQHLDKLTDEDNIASLRYQCPLTSYPPHRQWEVDVCSVVPIHSGGYLSSHNHAHGNVYTFGKSDFTLGYPSSTNNYKPKRIHSISNTSIVSVAAGAHHVVALTSEGVVLCWGHGKSGRLGVGDSRVRMIPTPVTGSLTHRKVRSIACSDVHTLACSVEGEVYAWGSNRWGQLGTSLTISTKASPRRVDSLRKSTIVDVACSVKHSVALCAGGSVYCWGSNENGQLGQIILTGGNVVNHNPEIVSKLTANSGNSMRVYAIDASEESTCVIARKGYSGCGISTPPAVFCFGYGDPNPRRIKFDPEEDSDPDSEESTKKPVSPIAIACAQHHTCCVTASGSVYVWGSHLETLGVAAKESGSPSKPILVPNLPPAVSVSASSTHTAIITRTGLVYTWGSSNTNGGLGVEGRKHVAVPVKVEGVRRCVGVAVGQEHTVCLSAFGRPNVEEEEEGSEEPEDLLNTTAETIDSANLEMDNDAAAPISDAAEGLPEEPGAEVFNPLSLQRGCELAIAKHVDTHNVVTILEKAASFYSSFLIDYCCEFLGSNLDGVLERLIAGKRKSELDFLLEFIAGEDQSCEAFMDEGFYEAIQKPSPEETQTQTHESPLYDFTINWDEKENLIESHKKVFKALRKTKKKFRKLSSEQADRVVPDDSMATQTQTLEKLLQRISDRMVHLGVPKEILKQNMAIKKAAEKAEQGKLEEEKVQKKDVVAPPKLKPRYRCEACGVEAPDEANLQIHMGGKRHRNTLIRLQNEPSSQITTPKKGWSPSPTASPTDTVNPTSTPSPPPAPVSFFNIPALPPSPLNFRELMEQQETQKKDLTSGHRNYKLSPPSAGSYLSRSPNSDLSGSISGSPPTGINLSDFMKKATATQSNVNGKVTPQKKKHVGALGTLLEKKVVSPWKKTPEAKDRRQRGFSDILEEEARVREGEMEAASPSGTTHWFVERRQRGDSLEAIQLAEEENRQRRLQEEKEREELRQQELLLKEAKKNKKPQTQKQKNKRKSPKGKGGSAKVGEKEIDKTEKRKSKSKKSKAKTKITAAA
ncbi:hypothetical protein TrST_g5285 [Triparma strigata]|uniref:C2H2-type domain-containing protein n=1 Tax=Triparma strigata TaxID=1606541 RepID=A0A9W7BUA2_9STRA|nr:hypothetical protein TrST_g5285 [Triparma strigata]